MGNAIYITKSQRVRDNNIDWYQSDEGTYGVSITCKPFHDCSNEWKFGTGALNEVISFYWFKKLITLAKNIEYSPSEIKPLLTNTKAEDIKHMCHEAVSNYLIQ